MMAEVKSEFESYMLRLTERSIHESARAAVESVIARHAGYGIDAGVKEVIKERAKEIVREPEFEAAIKDQLRRWLAQ